MRWTIYIVLAVLISSCTPQKTEKRVAEKSPEPEPTVTRTEAIRELPCFKCHSFGRFSSQEKGIFPHPLHIEGGYHCNQCHSFKGHSHVTIHTGVCKDCHNLKTFSLASSGFPVKFDHQFHAKLGCRECHPGIFPMKKGTTLITMEAMYKGRYCGECHDGKKSFASTDCAKCHEMKNFEKNLLYKVDGIGNAVFSHKSHTSMFKCDECHPKFFAMKKTQGKMTMEEMNKGRYCGGCHNGNVATSVSECAKCHKT